jgi:hypothetical protein
VCYSVSAECFDQAGNFPDRSPAVVLCNYVYINIVCCSVSAECLDQAGNFPDRSPAVVLCPTWIHVSDCVDVSCVNR